MASPSSHQEQEKEATHQCLIGALSPLPSHPDGGWVNRGLGALSSKSVHCVDSERTQTLKLAGVRVGSGKGKKINQRPHTWKKGGLVCGPCQLPGPDTACPSY